MIVKGMMVEVPALGLKGKVIWQDPWKSHNIAIETKEGIVHEVYKEDCKEWVSWQTKAKNLLSGMFLRK